MMAREPDKSEESGSGEPAGGDTAGEARPGESGLNRKIVTGAAIGIGSAALVAALLYANRSRKKPGNDRK